MQEKNKNSYDDIINLPHHISLKHKHMPLIDRAAQFAPFAALTGYEDEVRETARIVDAKIDFTEEKKEDINKKLNEIKSGLQSKPLVEIVYFCRDERKDGGKYIRITETVRKIDEYNKFIFMSDGTKIEFNNIADVKIKGSK